MAAIFKNGNKYVESMTSDLTDKTISTIDDVTTSYPEITTSDKGKTLFGKIKKYLSDLKNNKMDKEDPTGTGSFSLNRKTDTTIGTYSFAEGYNATASGGASHAEGGRTTASATSSHAEGSSTTASGYTAHAEGSSTVASGVYSHAQGLYTTAQRESQHVFGEYNVLDTTGSTTTRGKYVEIVGNGTGSSSRSNARTLDWDGNEVLAGSLTTTDVNTPSGSTWDGTNTSLATAISSLNSTLSTKQNASTAITTSNIGSQSVNYATSAGNSTKWNGKTDDSGTLNTTDTWIPIYASGKMQHCLRELWSGVQHCDYNNTNKRSYLATMSCLAFWNGAFNGNGASNLQYCDRGRFGTIVTKGSGEVVGTYSNGTYHNVSNLITFKDTNNALIGGGKGNYIFEISAWSDKRLKTNIKDSEVNALDLINKIQMREFDFIDEKFGKHKDIGYVAQELMEIIPECVEEVPLPDEDKEEYDVESMYQVEDKHIIPYLVKAIQELADIIKEQQKEIEELKVLIN